MSDLLASSGDALGRVPSAYGERHVWHGLVTEQESAARLVRDWSSSETFGLRGPRPEVEVVAVLANTERVARYAHERRRAADHLRAMGVGLVEEAGEARFLDADTIGTPDGRKWSGDRVIIAVGGRAGRLRIPGAELALTYEDVRTLSALPSRVCVVGAAPAASSPRSWPTSAARSR